MPSAADLFDRASVYSQHGLPDASLFRRLTAFLRLRPSVFLAGAQKAGTTSLAAYLSELPGIIGPWEKEISYFNNDDRYALGEKWYSSFFATSLAGYLKKKNSQCLTFDATANYFEEVRSAARIKSFDKNAKVIILLRDPVQRAWSHYKMAKKYGFEKLSFGEALQLEDARIASHREGHDFAFQRLGYRRKGEYIRYLPDWKYVFGDDLLVLFFEELFCKDPADLQKVHDFLGLGTRADLSKLGQMNKGVEEPVPPAEYEMLKKHFIVPDHQLAMYLGRKLPWQGSGS